MSKTSFRGLLLGATMLVAAGGAQAAPTTALYLAMDGSGSISASDFTLQVSGYVGALNGFFAAHPSAFGQVAIGASIFGANVQQFFALQTITDSTVLAALTSTIGALSGSAVRSGPVGTAAGDTASGLGLRSTFAESNGL